MKYNKMDGDSDAAEAHAKAAGKKKAMAKKMGGRNYFTSAEKSRYEKKIGHLTGEPDERHQWPNP